MSQLIPPEQTIEARYLRQTLIRDQIAQFVNDPLVMASADGVYYQDVGGKRILDGLSGIYVASVGHNNRKAIDAIRKQMDVLNFSPIMHGSNPQAIQLANQLANIAPCDLSAVKFGSGGSEATETAFKMARQYHKLSGNPEKYKVIS